MERPQWSVHRAFEKNVTLQVTNSTENPHRKRHDRTHRPTHRSRRRRGASRPGPPLQSSGRRLSHPSRIRRRRRPRLSPRKNTPEEHISAIILDCMLPGADGFTIVRALREAHHYTPILMLTARSRPEEVLEGIEAGADDYLAKPFDLNILLVRLKSLLRRTAWQNAATPRDSATRRRADPNRRIRLQSPHHPLRHPGTHRPQSHHPPHPHGGRPSPLPHRAGRPDRLASSRSSKTSGESTKTPIPVPSTTSSSVSAATSKTIPPIPNTSSPSAASVTASSPTPRLVYNFGSPRFNPAIQI